MGMGWIKTIPVKMDFGHFDPFVGAKLNDAG